jgi:potassium-dependent mechanosensitive channel
VRGRSAALAVVAVMVATLMPAGAVAGDEIRQVPGTLETQPAGQAQQQAGPPDVLEVPARARIVADSAGRAQRVIERLTTTGDLAAEVAAAARRQEDLQALYASMVALDFVRLERLSRLRDQALIEDGRLETLQDELTGRLARLSETRIRWTRQRDDWRRWRSELRAEPEFAAVAPVVVTTLARIDTVIERTSNAAVALLALQQQTEELRAEIERLDAEVVAIRTVRRRALLEREEPVLLSAAHRETLRQIDWAEWSPLAAVQPRSYFAFARAHTGLLLFHLLLAVAMGLGARRLRRPGAVEDRTDDDGWSGLLDHPWLLGVFASVVVAMQRIILAPPLWDVLLWILFGAAATVLSRALFDVRALRWTVGLLAALYPVLLLFEVVQLPAPVFRLALAVVAASALPLFLVLGRSRARAAAAADSDDPRRIWPLRIGAIMWGVVLVAVVAGYDALGLWALHATVTSAAVVFVVVLAFALVRSALPLLLRSAETGRRLRGAGVQVVQRVLLLLRIALVTGAALVLLDVWGIAESPVATWRRIWNFQLLGNPVEVTVGEVIVAGLVVYVAVLVSGVVRTLVTADVQRRQDGDRGLGESISRLVHYAVITLGGIIALAAIGVELQNFAIVAGALGIGVGFGLQNVVNNFASGLILLFERPVRVGDTVVVDDVWGTIQKIGLRSTVMVTFDQSEMIVPNADLVSEKVTNWTLSNPTARVILPVGVAYGSSISQVFSILVDSALSQDDVLNEPPPEALFVGFGDSSLDFELRVWVSNIRRRLQVRSAVLTDVERRLTAAGIEIPFPQRDLHLRSVDPDTLAKWTE